MAGAEKSGEIVDRLLENSQRVTLKTCLVLKNRWQTCLFLKRVFKRKLESR